MKKYIDAEVLKNNIHNLVWTQDMKSVEKFVDSLPAADVAEVRHGRWEWNESIKTEDMDGWFIDEQGYVCSECGFIGVDNFNYCPNCGAKMDGDTE